MFLQIPPVFLQSLTYPLVFISRPPIHPHGSAGCGTTNFRVFDGCAISISGISSIDLSGVDIVQEIAFCALQFKSNLCATNSIPAMVQQCGNWETCMSRDPTVVGRAKVGAELIAEVVNGFVEPISWKTLVSYLYHPCVLCNDHMVRLTSQKIFTLTSLSFLTIFINTLLSLYRARHHSIPAAPPSHPQPQFPIAPAPYPPHDYGGYLSPAPTPSWGRTRHGPTDEDMQTPTRRRRLDGGGAVKIK